MLAEIRSQILIYIIVVFEVYELVFNEFDYIFNRGCRKVNFVIFPLLFKFCMLSSWGHIGRKYSVLLRRVGLITGLQVGAVVLPEP